MVCEGLGLKTLAESFGLGLETFGKSLDVDLFESLLKFVTSLLYSFLTFLIYF